MPESQQTAGDGRITHHSVEVEDPGARAQIEALAGMLPAMIREGTASGMQDALGQPATWEAAALGFREAAKAQAGSMVLGALKAAVQKGLLFLALGGLVYWVGGWTALAAMWKALTGGNSEG